MSTENQRYPLSWPNGWKRTTSRVSGRFGRTEQQYRDGQPSWKSRKELSVSVSTLRVLAELQRMGVHEGNAIISTNVPVRQDGLPYSNAKEPSDPGAAVYWTLRGKQQCIAVDRYDRVADNLAAIAATLDAMRAIERHGGAEILERAFLGFAQLPQNRTGRPWREVFGIAGDRNVTREFIEAQYRSLAHVRHPDKGGTHEAMSELSAARDAALREVA